MLLSCPVVGEGVVAFLDKGILVLGPLQKRLPDARRLTLGSGGARLRHREVVGSGGTRQWILVWSRWFLGYMGLVKAADHFLFGNGARRVLKTQRSDPRVVN